MCFRISVEGSFHADHNGAIPKVHISFKCIDATCLSLDSGYINIIQSSQLSTMLGNLS